MKSGFLLSEDESFELKNSKENTGRVCVFREFGIKH